MKVAKLEPIRCPRCGRKFYGNAHRDIAQHLRRGVCRNAVREMLRWKWARRYAA